jgi:hypothetical protein
MLVAVDKFTKWIEATPVTTRDSTAAINFIKSLVFRFGVPHSIIIDNRTNVTSKEFKNYCKSMGIKFNFASIAHPQTNGQVEKANGLICSGIKKRLLAPLEKAKHAWVDELPSVLWSLQTTPNTTTQKHLSFWSITQKPCFQPKLLMKHPEYVHMMKPHQLKLSKTMSTHSMKSEMWFSRGQRNISKL